MPEQFDWSLVIWTAAVFLSGYLLGRRKRPAIEPPLEFDRASISPDARAQIENALQRDQKIEAIKLLREDTGLGLKDSKTVIDNWNSGRFG